MAQWWGSDSDNDDDDDGFTSDPIEQIIVSIESSKKSLEKRLRRRWWHFLSVQEFNELREIIYPDGVHATNSVWPGFFGHKYGLGDDV